MLWSFVRIMYSSNPDRQKTDAFRSLTANQNALNNRLLNSAPKSTVGWCDEQSDDKLTNNHDANDDDFETNDLVPTKHCEFKHVTGPPGGSIITQMTRGAPESSSDALNNIVHGDTELTVEHMDFIKSFRNGFLYIGPHDLTKNFSLPSNSMMNHDMQQTPRNQIISKERRDTSPVSLMINHHVHHYYAEIICTLREMSLSWV